MANPNWKKGVSGNIYGRPPKARALTDQLEKALARTFTHGERRISGKRLLAIHLCNLLLIGETKVGDRTLRIQNVREFLDITKLFYSQIDGPPKSEIDLTSGGDTLSNIVRIVKYGDDGDSV